MARWSFSGKMLAAIASLAGSVALPAAGQEPDCRQALALGLDISGSVDSGEYRMQIEGLAEALIDPSVIDALLSMPGAPVRLFIFEWSGLGTQRVLLDWTTIEEPGQVDRIASDLMARARSPREVATALGRAMEFGANALASQADCWKLTLDISGDGQSNIGPRPRDVRRQPLFFPITVNALVIGADAAAGTDRRKAEIGELVAYFSSEVIVGDGAFVIAALGYEDYADAMKRKLLREIEVLVVGQAAANQ